VIRPIDLGVCHGYEYEGDPVRTAIALPGSMLAGMPVLAFAIQGALSKGWRVIQVWDEFLDRSQDPTAWTQARLEAAIAFAAADDLLVIAKSLTTRAAGVAAERSLPAIWLTPLLNDPESVEMLRARTARALLIGGSADPIWDDALARELSEDVVELEGADHGLARVGDCQAVADAVAAFA
jgi:pimeloyl-ACP methyl ester carboxylesterase